MQWTSNFPYAPVLFLYFAEKWCKLGNRNSKVATGKWTAAEMQLLLVHEHELSHLDWLSSSGITRGGVAWYGNLWYHPY